jgi:hypothetical protein
MISLSSVVEKFRRIVDPLASGGTTTPCRYGAAEHFCILHIGKTAGTALKAVILQHNELHPEAQVEVFPHEMTLLRLIDKYPASRVAFFVRDPIERFISGFNSRLRKGRPRYNVEWSDAERRAFERFPTPSALGEALAGGAYDRSAAEDAMKSILHVRLDLTHYLHSVDLLEREKQRICFIGETGQFNADLLMLQASLNIDRSIRPPDDAVGAHRAPADTDRNLSPLARENLVRWHSNDYRIYAWCLEQRRMRLEQIHREKIL